MRLYYDSGDGASMLRVAVDQAAVAPGHRPDRGDTARVTLQRTPDDCERDTVISAAWPDGTVVRLDLASCLALDGARKPAAPPALNQAAAVLIAGDPRWGVTMDADLVREGAQQFPHALPVFDS